ncbi:alcohol dehydrogenase catalytic domain-containing protein [Kitasatospora camelliae]|uniref:Zinc-binding dehydrogenase n=1 Tax=Kitasatospora camelliae TaxID=3156397 RepID=A0AAU8JTU0_9ACTN
MLAAAFAGPARPDPTRTDPGGTRPEPVPMAAQEREREQELEPLPRPVELGVPRPGPGQVLIQVRAVCVLPGTPVPPGPYPAVPGGGVAGVVAQLGAGSYGWEVGDRVLGWCGAGAWAQYAAVPGDRLATRPDGLPWTAACVLGGAALVAESALQERGVGPGGRLLVLGAASGPGALGVQLAHARGAAVLAVAAPRHHARLRALGAVPVSPARAGATASGAVLDCSRLAGPPVPVSAERLDELVEFWAEGRLRVDVAAVLPLEHAGEARRLARSGRVWGSVLLAPASGRPRTGGGL